MMIELGMIQDLQHGMDGTSLGICSSVNQTANSRVRDGAGAHGARLDRDVEIAIEESIVADGLSGFAQREDFGMSGGIVRTEGTIAAATDHPTLVNDDGSHRHFAKRESASSFA